MYGIQLASWYSLFPTGGPQDAVMSLLEHLYIPEISVVYHYNKGEASSFVSKGVSIGGMEVKYNKPPVILAGLFRHIVKDDSDLYAGGIKLGITPYNFLAAGMYGDATGPPPKKETFKTMFIFVKLNGPLVELDVAEISGICGGFGYNSNLKFPETSQLARFPLLTTDGSAKYPLDELNALTNSSEGWITPQKGALWLAAGLEIKAFQVVDISAMAAMTWASPSPLVSSREQ
ncbi:hypothetical protein Slin15195_G052000 [Septoria linicola]|uniref:DUF6603 domain-containing protein n=1 Tax=Septoria linicola TaxID=215465 RepID=A0A9Q9AWD0_9PEZI|nr:hypothetical protein Slin15195_G052000 [Septoria linicola]